MTTWTEGDRLIAVAYKWIAEKHEAYARPLFTTDTCCQRLEDEVEATYGTGNVELMKGALKAFASHTVSHFQTAIERPGREALA